ncbi:uncharacterized protein ASPGLDRAFT_41486 [Aspergillus glaucus CBS 516.65]|uniref:Uncharacterized protein n=1 Tax=Aspergillus glaucus CBS 516.65 TaxID=1160497 RepID=A0A1L9VZX7_ASPGL|nr:hypothetical protein ASPGLDRAFT_41486 [Aspergillus glaucus CBS 516.65]OJJ89483.1 hypothetical protein ASPGLDRAFT_41486 [Aspergillus glaucus CBS 516.65]
MSLFYVMGPYIFHTPAEAAYVAVKVAKAVLRPQLGPQLAQQPPELKGHLHGVSSF